MFCLALSDVWDGVEVFSSDHHLSSLRSLSRDPIRQFNICCCFGNNFKRVEEVRTNDRFDDFFFCFCFDFCFCCRSHHFFLSWSQSPHSSAKVWSGTCHSHQHWGSWIWLRASRASFVVFLFFCGLQSFFEADGCNTGTSLRWVCF